MRTVCLTLPEKPYRTEAARLHFEERGVNAEFFTGINGEKMGVLTDRPYMRDRKPTDEKFFIGYHGVGIFLSHYSLWNAMTLMNDEHLFILEDDALFNIDWKPKFDQALKDVPQDFDVLFIGSCAAANQRHKKHINGHIYEVKYPMCFHAYIVAKKAVPVLLSTNRDCYAPIDISVTLHSFDKLKVYTLLPRIVSQFNTELEP